MVDLGPVQVRCTVKAYIVLVIGQAIGIVLGVGLIVLYQRGEAAPGFLALMMGIACVISLPVPLFRGVRRMVSRIEVLGRDLYRIHRDGVVVRVGRSPVAIVWAQVVEISEPLERFGYSGSRWGEYLEIEFRDDDGDKVACLELPPSGMRMPAVHELLVELIGQRRVP